jgi:hypothetical protein
MHASGVTRRRIALKVGKNLFGWSAGSSHQLKFLGSVSRNAPVGKRVCYLTARYGRGLDPGW